VSDQEWNVFYSTFYQPYVLCDIDADGLLLPAEMTACLTTDLAMVG